MHEASLAAAKPASRACNMCWPKARSGGCGPAAAAAAACQGNRPAPPLPLFALPPLVTWEKPPSGTTVMGDSADGSWAAAPRTSSRASRARHAALDGMAGELCPSVATANSNGLPEARCAPQPPCDEVRSSLAGRACPWLRSRAGINAALSKQTPRSADQPDRSRSALFGHPERGGLPLLPSRVYCACRRACEAACAAATILARVLSACDFASCTGCSTSLVLACSQAGSCASHRSPHIAGCCHACRPGGKLAALNVQCSGVRTMKAEQREGPAGLLWIS